MATEENNNQKWLQSRDTLNAALSILRNEDARISASSVSLIGAIEDAILDIDFDPTSEDGLSTSSTYASTTGRLFRVREGKLQKVRALQVDLFGGMQWAEGGGELIQGLFEEMRNVPIEQVDD